MTAVPTGVPVELGREAAQEAAREELAKQVYRDAGPGLVERLLRWLVERASEVLDDVAGVSPGGYAGVAVLVALLVVAAVAVRLRVGPLGRREATETALFVGRERTADEHRAAADRHAAAGEWAEAERHLQSALRVHNAWGARPWVALTKAALADVLDA
ncbi:MAG: hypothetical protein ACRDWY_19200, partial [Actinomycetes bacterium]